MALTDSLVSYWKLNGNSNDSVSTNNGTDIAISYAAGKISQAAGFNGSSSEISIADNSLLTPTSMSWSFWINPTALPTSGNLMGLIDKRENTSGTNGYLIQLLNNSGTQQILVYSINAGGYHATYNITLSTATWTHLVFILVNGSAPALYLNGSVQSAASSASGSTANYATALLFGRRSDGYYFNGSLDEIGIWSKVLSAGEITSLYNVGAGFTYPFASGSSLMSFMV